MDTPVTGFPWASRGLLMPSHTIEGLIRASAFADPLNALTVTFANASTVYPN